MSARATVTVVGGGIAGLAAAVGLAKAGWQVTVLERAPDFGEVGAGVAVSRNGMTALDALGLGPAVRSIAHRTCTGGFQDRSGRWLLQLPDTRDYPSAATTIWGVHRQRLHATLCEAAESAGAELVTGADVVAVRPGDVRGEPAAVTWRTGTGSHAVESDLVVGADGVRSTVRAQVAPGVRPRYGGSTCWRAVIRHGGLGSDRLVELWGPGGEFGAMPIGEERVYWFGYVREPEGTSYADELDAVRERFAGWPPGVRAALAATEPDQLMRHDVHYLPDGPRSYVFGRAVLVGDAAHACLPTIGQGVSLGVEDGVSLGRLVAGPATAGDELAAGVAAFDRARRPRCRRIVRQSALIARFGADLGAGRRQAIRNNLLRLVPARALTRAGAGIVRWTPPPEHRVPEGSTAPPA